MKVCNENNNIDNIDRFPLKSIHGHIDLIYFGIIIVFYIFHIPGQETLLRCF